MADVAELVTKNSLLYKSAEKKDSTVYIKNYYFPMLPRDLGDILSLNAGEDRLACSLFFEIDQEGLIDMSSIRVQESIVKVS